MSEPWVAGSIEELVRGASDRRPVRSSDAKSGATFETLTLDGIACFLKVLSADTDWIMRCTGNTSHWEFLVWRAGLYDQVPEVIDSAVLGMALDRTATGAPRLAMLMRDYSAYLVPSGDTRIPLRQHDHFLTHMAAMHAHNLGWRDDLGLSSLEQRFLFFAPSTIAPELKRETVPETLRVAERGWAELPSVDLALHDVVTWVHAHPKRLARLLAETPQTFVAGDWKLGNLGSRPDGATIVLDWAYPGEAPPCWELAWYLALNRARLPESKEETAARYRAALETAGCATGGWWPRQLDLCLIGIMATFAWEKAVGDADELAWWSRTTLEAADRCNL
jgi:hypothetical protein